MDENHERMDERLTLLLLTLTSQCSLFFGGRFDHFTRASPI
jgi:hypothetical protein